MRRFRRAFIPRVPILRIALLAVFLLLQVAGIGLYLQYENLIRNIDLATVRESYLPSLLHAPVAPLAGNNSVQSSAMSVPVLLYHGIIPAPDGSNVLIQSFREQMFALKKAGYSAVSLSDYLEFIEGKRQLPVRSFLLTFDDGRKDSYYPVDPIIKALGFHATMFVITGQSFRDGPPSEYYLGRDELREMRDSGRWDIQAHTRDFHGLTDIDSKGLKGHFYSNLRWLPEQKRMETHPEFAARVAADMRSARQDLEREIGVSAFAFAFPFGDYGQDTLNNPAARDTVLAAARATYAISFAQDRVTGSVANQNRPGTDHATLRRIEVYPEWTPENLMKVMELGLAKLLPFDDTFADYQGWQSNYGNVQYRGDQRMLMTVPGEGTSASAILDGAEHWGDYQYTVTFQPPSAGTNVVLVARYRSENSYVACAMTPERVRIEQRSGNTTKILVESKITAAARARTSTMTMIVNQDQITCDGPKTVTARIEPAAVAGLSAGGVGVKVWNPTAGAASIAVTEVHVAGV